jgi:hypothetical protein
MYLISTQCYEDYGYRVKAKGGRDILVEGTLEDAYAVKELIADEMEHVLGITPVEEGYESEFVKSQKEYGSWDTIYLDPVVRKGKSGQYYLKRGYIVGKSFESPLAGKFCGWVDNLSTGDCVLEIRGDERIVRNSPTWLGSWKGLRQHRLKLASMRIVAQDR